MNEDSYEILGLKLGATPDQIKDAYRKLAIKYHPDKSNEPDAEAKFKEVSRAYDILSKNFSDNNPSQVSDQNSRSLEGLIYKEFFETKVNQDVLKNFDFELHTDFCYKKSGLKYLCGTEDSFIDFAALYFAFKKKAQKYGNEVCEEIREYAESSLSYFHLHNLTHSLSNFYPNPEKFFKTDLENFVLMHNLVFLLKKGKDNSSGAERLIKIFNKKYKGFDKAFDKQRKYFEKVSDFPRSHDFDMDRIDFEVVYSLYVALDEFDSDYAEKFLNKFSNKDDFQYTIKRHEVDSLTINKKYGSDFSEGVDKTVKWVKSQIGVLEHHKNDFFTFFDPFYSETEDFIRQEVDLREVVLYLELKDFDEGAREKMLSQNFSLSNFDDYDSISDVVFDYCLNHEVFGVSNNLFQLISSINGSYFSERDFQKTYYDKLTYVMGKIHNKIKKDHKIESKYALYLTLKENDLNKYADKVYEKYKTEFAQIDKIMNPTTLTIPEKEFDGNFDELFS